MSNYGDLGPLWYAPSCCGGLWSSAVSDLFFKSILCILCQQSVVRRFEQNHEESWIDAQNEKYFHISRVRRCVEFSLFKHETFNLFLQSNVRST